MMRVMDMDYEHFVVHMVVKEKVLKVPVKRGMRLRNGWLVKVEKNFPFNLESIPPPRYDGNILRITSVTGKVLSVPGKIPSKVVLTEEQKGEAELQVVDEDMIYYYGDRLGGREIQGEDFWRRQGMSPSLPGNQVGVWQKELKRAPMKEDGDLSRMVLRGLAKATRQGHRRCLKWLLEAKPPKDGVSMANWILRLFEEKGAKWKGSTMAKEMATAQGALANLPVYRQSMAPVLLKTNPEWRMGLKGAGVTARQQLPDQAKIATWELMKEAIRKEPATDIKVALEVMWVTAGRGSDITKLMAREVKPSSTGTKVRFVIGKTANTQPYTVDTVPISQAAREFVREKQEKEEGKCWLFPALTVEKLLDALRRADKALGTRSVRRGALQSLAASGLTDKELMAYSQHRCIETLRRYLDFGWKSGEAQARSSKAAVLELFMEEEEEEEEEGG